MGVGVGIGVGVGGWRCGGEGLQSVVEVGVPIAVDGKHREKIELHNCHNFEDLVVGRRESDGEGGGEGTEDLIE